MNYMHIYTSGLYPSTFADLHFSYKKLSFLMAIDFWLERERERERERETPYKKKKKEIKEKF